MRLFTRLERFFQGEVCVLAQRVGGYHILDTSLNADRIESRSRMFDGEPAAAPRPTSGVWSLGDDGPELIEAAPAGPVAVLIPTEEVLLLAADLPLPTRRQRMSALPFAIEDALSQPVEHTHIALGAEIGARRFLAAAVSRATMVEWTARLSAAGFEQYVLTPDVFQLPPPAAGGWTVRLTDERALVRTEEGGFALPPDLFRRVWIAQGQPPLWAEESDLGAVALDLPIGLAVAATLADRVRAAPLNLRQGAFAPPAPRASVAMRRLAAVLVVGVIAHGVIAIADTVALQRIASQRRVVAEALLQAVAPGAPVSPGLTERLDRLGADDAERTGFLPLMARAMKAIEPVSSEVSVQGLNFSDAEGSLALKMEASDLGQLQRVQAAMADAGLRPVAGPASTTTGRAEGEISVRDLAGAGER